MNTRTSTADAVLKVMMVVAHRQQRHQFDCRASIHFRLSGDLESAGVKLPTAISVDKKFVCCDHSASIICDKLIGPLSVCLGTTRNPGSPYFSCRYISPSSIHTCGTVRACLALGRKVADRAGHPLSAACQQAPSHNYITAGVLHPRPKLQLSK